MGVVSQVHPGPRATRSLVLPRTIAFLAAAVGSHQGPLLCMQTVIEAVNNMTYRRGQCVQEWGGGGRQVRRRQVSEGPNNPSSAARGESGLLPDQPDVLIQKPTTGCCSRQVTFIQTFAMQDKFKNHLHSARGPS